MPKPRSRPPLTLEVIREYADPGAFQRGKKYFYEGHVIFVDVIRDDPDDLHFIAETLGSGSRFYRQTVRIKPGQDPRHLRIFGDCNCPVRVQCKHVVAACLAYMDGEALNSAPHAKQPFTDWLEEMALMSQEGFKERISDEFLVYQLDRVEIGADTEYAVTCRVARTRKNGTAALGREIGLQTLMNPYGMHQEYLNPTDQDILSQLYISNMHFQAPIKLQNLAGGIAMDLMLQTGRLFWGRDRDQPLQPGEPRTVALTWLEQDGDFRLVAQTEPKGGLPVDLRPPRYVDPETHEVGALEVPEGLNARWLSYVPDAPLVSPEELQEVSETLAIQYPQLPRPKALNVRTIKDVAPVPELTVHVDRLNLTHSILDLNFLYEGLPLSPLAPTPVVTAKVSGGLAEIHRDVITEAQCIERLTQEGLVRDPVVPSQFALESLGISQQVIMTRWLELLNQTLPRLQEEGWRIHHEEGDIPRLDVAEDVHAQVDEGNGWFDLHFDLEVDGRKVPLLPLVSELIGSYQPGRLPPTLALPMQDGSYVQVTREQIEPVLQAIIDLYDHLAPGQQSLRLSRLDAPRLLELGDAKVQGGQDLQHMARRLTQFEALTPVEPPRDFRGDLRAYQQQGLNWLQFLREYQLGGVLADDMGLGKTVQTLAHLAIEKQAGRLDHPALIVAPTSLMSNWRREAEQFTPDLKVLTLHGPDRKRYYEQLPGMDLALTTYPLLPRDSEELLAQDFSFLILDEAQQIKNPRAQASQVVRRIKATHRLCLTGTPMENHLGELWAQFDFLMPGFLGGQEQFSRTYRTPIEKHNDGDKLRRLTRRTTPFMLRRTKDIVAKELPGKTELLRSTPISGKQAALYESIRLAMEKKVRDAIAKRGLARSHITVLDALLKLRQVCCDPRLLPASAQAGSAPSAKLQMLMEMLPELLDEGRRVLLFSQFTTMLGLIEQELKKSHIGYSKLTGQTRKREEALDIFRNGHANLMLISLKAGGVGLNLTEADTVIHYDPWWNPAVESQATDRAHRIGQDKPVFVYKLITENTVEEKILAMQARKQKLADNVYGDEKRDADEPPIDADMIHALFAPEPG
ncbi:DEAD/DEAH box helicase [Ectothiorhodospira variabilis]|uniref:DEAD/DEAH box helicase n=1 Tax=Ectothiorhodospira variabilis TaxID=505694 RepID=UPI001EFAA310|nr:DEAD/DEAH box helicase [Ectothiorhodospira variabilis]MCG5497976.1 DEAD/DEAH box helicase [Ectothiorhodospira variabilis]